jgi:hypothetical protein
VQGCEGNRIRFPRSGVPDPVEVGIEVQDIGAQSSSTITVCNTARSITV